MTTIEIDKEEYERLLKIKTRINNANKKYAETHKDKMNEIRRRSYHKKKAEDPTFMERERVRCRERYQRIKAEKVTKVFLPSVDEK